MVGTSKYLSSWGQNSVNISDINPRETQKVTSGSKEFVPQISSPGVHPKFWLGISPNLVFNAFLGILFEKMSFFSQAFRCFDEWARLMLFTWKQTLVTKAKFIQNYFSYFWYTPKRHTIYRIQRKLQIGYPKIAEIRAKFHERQGKNKSVPSKMFDHPPFLFILDNILYSLRKVTMKSTLTYIWQHAVPTTNLCFKKT